MLLRLSFGCDTRLSKDPESELPGTRGTWLLGKAISLTVLIEFNPSALASIRKNKCCGVFGFSFSGRQLSMAQKKKTKNLKML